MVQISGMDLSFLVKDFQILVEGKIDKIYQLDKKEFLFNFHISGIGKKSLWIKLPDFIILTDRKLKTPENPPGFCMYLRKKLNGARLREISQVGFERILKFVFETKDEKYFMFVEIFSKGNIIFCDTEMNILQPLERQAWKDREIKAKVKYILPKSRFDDLSEIKELLIKTKRDKIVTFLALDVGLGGKYAEIVCNVMKINKDISPSEVKNEKIIDAIKEVLELKEVFVDKEVYPCEIEGSKKVESFSAAVNTLIPDEMPHEEKQENTKVKKLIEIIRNQENHIKALEKEIEEYNKVAEVIYSNYQFLQKILEEFNSARKTMDIIEIQKKVKNKSIKNIDGKEKTITFIFE